MPGFKVINDSHFPIHFSISNYTNNEHHPSKWMKLKVGATRTFTRDGYEALMFKDTLSGLRRGWYLDCKDRMVDVVFRGVDHQLGVPKEKRGFNIRNVSGTPGVKVFVSKFSHRGGSDEWYEVPSDFEDPEKYFWRRKSWEIVVFVDPETQKRKGLYLNPEDSTLDVTFNGFDKEVTVSPPPAAETYPYPPIAGPCPPGVMY